MARYTVNPDAVAFVRKLIAARRYVLDSDWGDVQPGAAEQNAFLQTVASSQRGGQMLVMMVVFPLLMLLIWLISGLVLMFGNLAFVIYGVVGAAQVYRGKDFRYAIIGRMVARRNS